jgi:hypothetical protein
MLSKPLVRSWDVFDTLIARRCGDPNGIFDILEPVLGSGFKQARLDAEHSVRKLNREISLNDIYDHLQMELGWTEEYTAAALELELRTELDNVIPIAENMSRLRDGDIAVSDMYLSEQQILNLLRAAGLKKDLKVFVSNNGKADGRMWRRLKKQFLIVTHTGDNPRSDFLRPLRHGIFSKLSEISIETAWERLLRCNGAPALSAYVREMRIRSYQTSKELREVQAAQIQANLPLLLLSSAALVKWCDEHGIRRALMSSRDCVLWTPLAEKVARHAGSSLAVEYFLTSRVAALKSSVSYLNYAAARMGPDSVVVDISMTGTSLAGLADRLGMKQVKAFVIAWHQSIARSLYGESFRSRATVAPEFLTAETIDEDLEALNQALTPSIHDVLETNGVLNVTYAVENRSTAVLDAVRAQHAAFNELVEVLPAAVVTEALSLAGGTRLVFLARECARHAGSLETVISKAQPGAALWNDPNGRALGLSYATRSPASRWLALMMKRMVKPVVRRGSFLHSLGKTSPLIFQALKNSRR